MPARLDSEFCSEACRNMHAQIASLPPSTPNHRGQQLTATVIGQSSTQGKRPNGGEGGKKRNDNSVPEGLGPTCQECRRPIVKETRIGSRYCSKACEDASRANSSC